MQEVALVTDADFSDDGDKDKVTLMTVHAAKGLEFPYVFVVGLEENLFPSIQSLSDRADLEEERRLFYVAITRARTGLSLSFAENRYKWGNLTICEPSRFLQEIPEQCIDTPKKSSVHTDNFLTDNNFSANLPGFQLPRKKSSPPPNFQKVRKAPGEESPDPTPTEEIQPGMEVMHERFGKGKVLSVDGAGPNKKATVFFHGVGQKQLLLRFARLSIVA
jgi:DNA helicase-2/ATP-dependent DNA helicase PcrA